MEEAIKVKLIAKKDLILGDMFDGEHGILEGEEFHGEKANLQGLKIVAINIGGNDMYYFQSWVEEFFEIIELDGDTDENG